MARQNLSGKLSKIYSQDECDHFLEKLQSLKKDFLEKSKHISAGINISHQLLSADIALITYANTVIYSENQPCLPALSEFLNKNGIPEFIRILHILPFYPWDTDRGFSVKDYYQVDEAYGNWEHLDNLKKFFKLMFDFVANHASIDNPLVQKALIAKQLGKDDKRLKDYDNYSNFVIAYSDSEKPNDEELTTLVRPRPFPVLTRYYVYQEKDGQLKAALGNPANEETLGSGWVWTTFSRQQNADGSENTRQVDLNFRNPDVLLEVIKILLFYVQKGCDIYRLDAIGYIWKKIGSASIHEKEAHIILEIIHDIISDIVPDLITIAEVNEPQNKVAEYLGTADNKEADLIYQFTHFPLAIYSLLTENGGYYLEWLKTLNNINGKQFITVMGSHDGLGLKPIRGILPEAEIEKLIDILVNKNQGLPNFAVLPGGKKIIYEVCATPWNLVNPINSQDSFEIRINRYLAVAALGLMLRGIPAFYFNSLIGSPNYLPTEGLDENRTVNREVFIFEKLQERINNPDSETSKIFKALSRLIKIRSKEKIFDPENPPALPLNIGNNSVIAQILQSKNNGDYVLGLVNLSKNENSIVINEVNLTMKLADSYKDLISDQIFVSKNGNLEIRLSPYQILWLKN